MISATISRAVERAVPALPGALDRPVAEVIGTLAFLASPRARAAVVENLSVIAQADLSVIGQRDLTVITLADRGATPGARLARRVFVEQVRHYLETFRIMRLTPERLLAMVEIEGWGDLVRALARGRGVVLASAHLGPVVLCGQVLAARGLDVSVVVEPKAGDLGRLVDRARSAMGIRTIETRSAMAVVRALRRGGVVGFLADRPVTGVGERVPFFGRDALLPSAHVAIALRSGAALVPAFASREGGRLRARILAELELPRTGDRDADVREGVRRWAAVLERHVARSPEQWSVFGPVWI